MRDRDGGGGDPVYDCNEYDRLTSVGNDAGYAIGWNYVNPTGPPVAAWFERASAVLSNANAGGAGATVAMRIRRRR